MFSRRSLALLFILIALLLLNLESWNFIHFAIPQTWILLALVIMTIFLLNLFRLSYLQKIYVCGLIMLMLAIPFVLFKLTTVAESLGNLAFLFLSVGLLVKICGSDALRENRSHEKN